MTSEEAYRVAFRCFSSCQQELSQHLQLTLLGPTKTSGMVAAELIRLSSNLSAELRGHFEALPSGTAQRLQTLKADFWTLTWTLCIPVPVQFSKRAQDHAS